ncbi:MAG: transcriptional regulator MraZ [Patescibacteria group bacterium]|nr:MAG: transcriptional regulator MraZ [Patescibacteria group bacterium]
MVFFGEYQLSFTSPGRLVLPKRIRELLKGNTFILTKGFDLCLAGYDKEDWENRAKELFKSSLLSKENLDKQRLLFSSIVYLEIDDQGRFVIPKNLLTYAGLKKDVVILGVGDHFEIWDQESWKKYSKDKMNL